MAKIIQLNAVQLTNAQMGKTVIVGGVEIEARPARGGWVVMVTSGGFTVIIVYGASLQEINEELSSACAQHGWEA
jgi:hypothetical protein